MSLRSQIPGVLSCTPAPFEVSGIIETALPAQCLPVPVGATVECSVDSVTCSTETTGVPDPTVPVTVHALFEGITATIRNPDGSVHCVVDLGDRELTDEITVACTDEETVTCTCALANSSCACELGPCGCGTLTCDLGGNGTVACSSGPDPTEIVCIETQKVYDFCFQSDSVENACFPIPAMCLPPVPGNVLVECSICSVTTSVINRVPLPPPAPAGFQRITIEITVTLRFTLRNPDSSIRCTFCATFPFLKTIALCAPTGTDIDVEVTASRCGPCFILNGTQICCEIDLCVLIESLALIKLLVPAFGFCTPAECVELPKTPLVCPPTPLFPPQCILGPGNTR